MVTNYTGICYTRLGNGDIDFVMVRDSNGYENQLPSRVYVERNMRPVINSLPERRDVVCVKKDKDGNVIGLGNKHESWIFVEKENAIGHIENGKFKYYVSWDSGVNITEIKVVEGQNGKYLRTDRDLTSKNNLDELPDCQ